MTISERRTYKRLSLEVPVMVSMSDEKGKQKSYELMTRDISSGGVFLLTEYPIKEGTDLQMDIMLSFMKNRSSEEEKRSRINISGSVVRTEDLGMAVSFNTQYKIFPL